MPPLATWRRCLAVTAVTALACAGGASAMQSTSSRTLRPFASGAALWRQAVAPEVAPATRLKLAVQAWRESVAARLLDSGWHDFEDRPHLGGRPIHVWPTGDLDGDGAPDLMRLQNVAGWYDASTYSSRTGQRLWTNNNLNAIAVPVDVGGVRGGRVLLVQPVWTFLSPLTAVTTLNLVLLGPDGKPLWTNTRTGLLASSPASITLADVPWVGDLDRYLAGRRQALLIGEASAQVVLAGPEVDWRGAQHMSYLGVDDGTVTHVADSVSPSGPQTAAALGHLNGARAPACFGLGQQLTAGKVNVLVYCGTQRAWSQTYAQHWPNLRNAGDVDGDHISDVYLSDSEPDPLGDPVPGDPGVLANTGPPLLVSGRDGHVLPSRLPRLYFSDTPLGGPGKGQRSPTFLRDDLYIPNGLAQWTLTTVTPANRTVWRHVFSLGRVGTSRLELFPIGDIDGDGTTDVELALWTNVQSFDDGPTRTVDIRTGPGIVSPGSGQLVPESVSAHGMDRDHLWLRKGRLFWTVRRANGQLLNAGSVPSKLSHVEDPQATMTVRGHHYLYWISGNGLTALNLDAKRVAWTNTT